jgi:hypothetical protein
MALNTVRNAIEKTISGVEVVWKAPFDKEQKTESRASRII